MERLVANPVGNFLTFDDEEQIVGPVRRVEAIDGRQMIVICQHEKRITVLTIPAHHVVGSRIAVAC